MERNVEQIALEKTKLFAKNFKSININFQNQIIMKWIKVPNVAMYGKADWNSGFIKIINNTSAEAAQVIAGEDPNITFFFFARQGMYLPPLSKEPRFQNGQFSPGDAVFFKGGPWWGSAPQCDAYEKSTRQSLYQEGSAIYVAIFDELHHVSNPDTLTGVFGENPVITNGLPSYPKGFDINPGSCLVRSNTTGAIYLFTNGHKYHLTSPEAMQYYQFNGAVFPVNANDQILADKLIEITPSGKDIGDN